MVLNQIHLNCLSIRLDYFVETNRFSNPIPYNLQNVQFFAQAKLEGLLKLMYDGITQRAKNLSSNQIWFHFHCPAGISIAVTL
jgi:hypothetical protein